MSSVQVTVKKGHKILEQRVIAVDDGCSSRRPMTAARAVAEGHFGGNPEPSGAILSWTGSEQSGSNTQHSSQKKR